VSRIKHRVSSANYNEPNAQTIATEGNPLDNRSGLAHIETFTDPAV